MRQSRVKPKLNVNQQVTTVMVEWPRARLADVARKIGSGSTPRGGEAVYRPSGVPLIRSMNVHFAGLKPDGIVYLAETEARKLKNVIVQPQDVLLNITGASIGRVTTAPDVFAGARVNQHVCIIRTKPELLPTFLAQFLASPLEQARVMDVQVGATRQALTKAMIEYWEVPLPSLEEQRGTVAEIEKQFTRLEAGLEALRRLQANLRRYRVAVLKAACEGRLVPTEVELARSENRKAKFQSGEALLASILNERRQNWQGRRKYKEPVVPNTTNLPKLPSGWCWAGTEQVTAGIDNAITIGPFGSNLMVKDYLESGVPLIFVREIRSENFRRADARYISAEKAAELVTHKVRGGDVVITKMGEPPGDTAIYPEGFPDAVATSDCIKLTPNLRGTTAAFLKYVIRGQPVKNQIERVTRGVAQKKMSLARFKTVAVPFPPLVEQTRIVAEVERRLSVVQELEAVVLASLQRATRLRQAILKKAFHNFNQSSQGLRIPEQIKSHWVPQFLRPAKPTVLKSKIMKSLPIQTATDLVTTVKREGGKIDPANLCAIAGFDEDVEVYFDLLRDCRNRRLLIVPSGKNATISLSKS